MRRITTILFLLICTMTMTAQKLAVESFALKLNDLTASTQSRNDSNGNACALVKVLLATSGATFKGNTVGNVDFDVNQYLVYMAPGSKRLQINLPNFLPLNVNFAEYGISSVERKQTYELVVVLPTTNVVTTADPGGNYFVLTVKPANAVVTIDGKSLNPDASGEYMKMYNYGNHSYSIVLPGYVEKTGNFTIEHGKKTELNVNLESAFATLTVTCPTTGASIYVDGKSVGTTSWTGFLQEGMYLIEAKKEGYRNVQKSVTLAERQKQTILLDSLSPIVGSLDIAYRPIGADIYVDGKKLDTTPSVLTNIPIGTHKLEIRKGGYVSETKDITIFEGKTATLQGSLSPVSFASGSSVSVIQEVDYIDSHTYVDLGLSVKWATCNIGASKPEKYGYYFAWGETSPKTDYSLLTYKYCRDTILTKYCKNLSPEIDDNKAVLDLEDDAAHVNWGDSWRMPTKEEQDELRSMCTWEWTKQNGVNGYKVTSKINGNSLFLPAAGYRGSGGRANVGSNGYYWASSISSDGSSYAYHLFFYSSLVLLNCSCRYYGLPVRPVCP